MYNYALYLKAHNSYVCDGYVKGTLYTIKDRLYPALVDGEQFIIGEIHEVNDKVLKALDKMENYFGSQHIDNEYNKVLCNIYNGNKEVIEQLPVYMYNISNPKNLELLDQVIEENDYVLYIQNKNQPT